MTECEYRFYAEPDQIAEYLRGLCREPSVALDFEADSLHSYREKICLAQVSTRQDNAVLDSLAAPSVLAELGPVLADPAVQKVFHGGDYDVRLLKRGYGFALRNLFDTMIAAQLLGRPRVGLAALLADHFDVQMDKKYQRANWAARPLSSELLAYAALDTARLLPLRDLLEEELVRLGRREWAEEEFRLLEAVTPGPERRPWCLDVKGAGRLHPRQLAVLQKVLEVRENAAAAWDRPPFKVLGNDVLLAWAQKPPDGRAQLLETPGAGSGVLKRLASELLDAIHQALALPLAECPTPTVTPRTPLDAAQERTLKVLKKKRAGAAERLGIEPGLLVNSATLERLARAAREDARTSLVEWLKHWQMEAVGDDLREALAS
jgi:ribonuclease D